MEIFRPPDLDAVELEVLDLIDGLRDDMRHRVAEPPRWAGNLRRTAMARAVQASNSIEGYDASLDDVAAAVDGEPTLDAGVETQLALAGYRDAMTYVLQVAEDDQASIDEGLVKALHFMMLRHDLEKSPGRWRGGYVAVRRHETGDVVYEGPQADRVPSLMDAMLEELRESRGPVVVRAAMAHLNLAMIHPFRDGNGLMARCLQTLALARERIVAPVFASIEEYLGRNTQAYYQVLAEVGRGSWNPHRSARPWVRFCMTAHYRQARTHLRRIEETEELWNRCSSIAESHGLPDRVTGGLTEAALGFRLRNASYRALVQTTAGDEISELTASRDLKSMVGTGLLEAVGEKRGRHYLAGSELRQLWAGIRTSRPPLDDYAPFAVATRKL